MKKCLIIFIIAIILIIPTFNVNASFDVTLNNGTDLSLPDLPFNKNEYNYVVARDTSVSKGKVNQIFAYPKKYTSKLYFRLDYSYQTTFRPKICVSSLEEGMTYETYSMYIEENSWTSHTTHEISSKACYELGISNTIVYSTDDLPYYGQDSSYFDSLNYYASYDVFELMNFDTRDFKSGDIVFHKPKLNLLTLEYEEMYNIDYLFKYYNISLIANDFNPNYKYEIKFGDDPFTDITNYLSNGPYTNSVYRNCTLYMQVADETGKYIEFKTFTFNDLGDENLSIPDVTLNVSYFIDDEINLPTAKINLKFSFISHRYIFKYSFSNHDYNINHDDIENLEYNIYTSQNGVFTIFIYNLDGECLSKKSVAIDGIVDSDNFNTYYINVSDLYNYSDNSLNIKSFYFNNFSIIQDGKGIVPYFYFSLIGDNSKTLSIGMYYDTNVKNSSSGIVSYLGDINTPESSSFDIVSFPFEMRIKDIPILPRSTLTYFSFIPYFNPNEERFYDYTTQQIKIITNMVLKFDEPIKYNGKLSYINFPNDSNNIDNSFFRIFSNSFDRFKSVIIEIFRNCTYFFNNSNDVLQDFFIVVFVLILFLFLIRFIL